MIWPLVAYGGYVRNEIVPLDSLCVFFINFIQRDVNDSIKTFFAVLKRVSS